MPAYESANATFHKLFSNDDTSLEEQARMTEKRSILDTVLADARAVRRRTNRSDHNGRIRIPSAILKPESRRRKAGWESLALNSINH